MRINATMHQNENSVQFSGNKSWYKKPTGPLRAVLNKMNMNRPWKGFYKETPEMKDAFKLLTKDFHENTYSPFELEWEGWDVRSNLRNTLDGFENKELLRVARMALPQSTALAAPLLATVLEDNELPASQAGIDAIKEELVNIQEDALKAITNHALTAEQASVSPLSKGIDHYKRYPALQEMLTQFVADEAKHAGMFFDYLNKKLGETEETTYETQLSFKAFSKVADRMPGSAVFLALAVETVGCSFFEFFAEKCPEPFFREELCRQIAEKDERRHIKICQDTYNKIYRRDDESGTLGKIKQKWEHYRNKGAIKVIAREVYGNHANPDHHLMLACRAFGVEPRELVDYITGRLENSFAEIGFELDKTLADNINP